MLEILFKIGKNLKQKGNVDKWFKVFTYNAKDMSSILYVAFRILFLKVCTLSDVTVGPK